MKHISQGLSSELRTATLRATVLGIPCRHISTQDCQNVLSQPKAASMLRRVSRRDKLVGVAPEDVLDDDDGLLHDVVELRLDQLQQHLRTTASSAR